MTKGNKQAGGGRPGDPCIITIFGAAGDLTKRKLLPALYNLYASKLLPEEYAIVGVARREMSHEAFREQMSEEIRKYATGKLDDALWKEFRSRLYFSPGEFPDAATYQKLSKLIAEIESKHGTGGNVLYYLSTPPDFFAEIVNQLGAAKLADQARGRWRRVIIEKPFGHDLDSARVLNGQITKVLHEDQIYRIDHYLGKETVQNIMAFRFANGVYEPIWNRRYIDHVQILVAESIGVEGRGGFYEKAGILRDMIQNHMFQLLSLVAMEPPISFQADKVRDEKVKVLDAIRPMDSEEVLRHTVRGQYGEGFVKDKKVPAYRTEPKVSAESATETYAALKLYVENWRWAGVPFYLRSGKRLAARKTHIMIQFRLPPLLLFPQSALEQIEPNRLVLHVQPKESISFEIKAKVPGPTIRLKGVKLQFSYQDFGALEPATGYERLLYDATVGDSTLYHRTDMVESAWRIATPVLDVWGSLPPRDFPNYASGTWGPASSDQLIQRDGREWWNGEEYD